MQTRTLCRSWGSTAEKTPAAIRKAEEAVQEKYEEVCGRLEEAAARLGEVERLAGPGGVDAPLR